eukprot:gene37027-44934_t
MQWIFMLVGLAMGIYGLTQGLLQIPFGMASDRLGRKRVEADGVSAEREALRAEAAALQRKLSHAEDKLRSADEAYASLEQEFAAHRAQAQAEREEAQRAAEERQRERDAEVRDSVRRVRERMEEEMQQQEKELLAQQQALEEERRREAQRSEAELRDLTGQLVGVKALVTEERMEKEALKLRLKDKEAQILALQSESKSLRSLLSSLPLGAPQASHGAKLSIGEASLGLGLAGEGLPDLPSPPMSLQDDASWLHSPVMHGSLGNNMGGFRPPLRMSSTPQKPPPQPPALAAAAAMPVKEEQDRHDNRRFDVLKSENDQLKELIREMRRDLEELKSKPPTPHPSANAQPEAFPLPPPPPPPAKGDEGQGPAGDSLLVLLERRNKEILRLRDERKRLMDTGNELRAALRRVGADASDSDVYDSAAAYAGGRAQVHSSGGRRDQGEGLVEQARVRNLNAILHWIDQASPPPAEGDRGAPRRPSPSSRNAWDYVPRRRQAAEDSEESKAVASRPGELGGIGGAAGLGVSGRSVGQGSRGPAASNRAAVQRVDLGRGRGQQQALGGGGGGGGTRKVRNYALGEDPSSES